MAVVLKTEKKNFSTVLLYSTLYLVLCMGALTMVYPFLLMVSGSLKTTSQKPLIIEVIQYNHRKILKILQISQIFNVLLRIRKIFSYEFQEFCNNIYD